MTREQEIDVIAKELEKHPEFAGDFIKAAVWATRIWSALHPFDGAEIIETRRKGRGNVIIS